MKGKVKFFNEMKGFGFIEGDDGKEYFVHHTSLQNGIHIRESDPVSFDVEDGDRGPKAVNVSMASGKASKEEETEEEEEQEETEEEEEEED